jgi:parallel beta-helix repeat protein
MITATDFGVIADPAVDNSLTLQALIDAASDHSRITLPAGVYGFTKLRIHGREGVVLSGPGTLRLLALPAQTIATFGPVGVLFEDCLGCGVAGVALEGSGLSANGIGFRNSTRCFAEDCDLSAFGGNGQVVAAGGIGTRIERNRLHDSVDACRGMWIGNVQPDELEREVVIRGNVSINNDASGIALTAHDAFVEGNRCQDNAGSGVAVSGAVGNACRRVLLSGNTCVGNLFHGIQADPAIGCVVADVTVSDNDCSGNVGSGIFLVRSARWAIRGNRCFDNNSDKIGSGHGVAIDDDVEDVVVDANLCGDTRAYADRSQTAGVSLIASHADKPVRRVTVAGNICRGMTYGIFAQVNPNGVFDGISVNGNVCFGNGTNLFMAESLPARIVSASVVGNVLRGGVALDFRRTVVDLTQVGNVYTTVLQ